MDGAPDPVNGADDSGLDLAFARTAPNEGRRCRRCGCTDTAACLTPIGPCWWIADDLCSNCGEMG